MTARPPEDPSGYSDYGDPSGSTTQYGYGQYGEQGQRVQPGQYGGSPDPYAAPADPYADPGGQYADPSGQTGPYPQMGQYPDPSGQSGPYPQSGQYPDPSGQYADPGGPYTGQFDAAAQYGGDQLAATGMSQVADEGGPGAGRARPRPARSRKGGGAAPGFLGSLFDFDFTSFVTPKIIKSVYLLAVVALGLSAIGFIFGAFAVSIPFGVVTLILLAPVYFVLGVAFFRVMLEFFMVVFRMAEDIHDIRERGGSTG